MRIDSEVWVSDPTSDTKVVAADGTEMDSVSLIDAWGPLLIVPADGAADLIAQAVEDSLPVNGPSPDQMKWKSYRMAIAKNATDAVVAALEGRG